MPKEWRSINDMYFIHKGVKQQESKTVDIEEESVSQKKEETEYKIVSVECIEPSQGWQQNNPFKIKGKVEKKITTIKKKRLLIDVKTDYNGKGDIIIQGAEAFIQDDLSFETEIKNLFYNESYLNDRLKPPDVKFELYCNCYGNSAENKIESSKILLPAPSKEIILKRGNYDDTACKQYPDRRKADGEGYIKGTAVTDLQKELIDLKYLRKNDADGDFGPKTEKAVKQFQQDSLQNKRLDREQYKIIEVKAISYKGEANGMADNTVQDEIQNWKTNKYIRPLQELYYGHFDDEGVRKKNFKKDDSDYLEGKPILEAQKELQSINVYTGCSLDGWFHKKTEDAVKEFQQWASTGEFTKQDNTRVVLPEEERLKGYQKGVFDIPTQEALKICKENGLKILKDESKKKPKWIEIAEKEIKTKEIKGDKDNPRIIEYHSTTILKATDDETPWCSSFVNWVMTKAGYKGTDNARAKSWKNWDKKVDKPVYGAIAVFDYGARGGHVGFVVGKNGARLIILGGNQSNQVKKTTFKIDKIVAYVLPEDYDPKNAPEIKDLKNNDKEADFSSTR